MLHMSMHIFIPKPNSDHRSISPQISHKESTSFYLNYTNLTGYYIPLIFYVHASYSIKDY